MEIINFINDLRKKKGLYYTIWMPIILQFSDEKPIIKIKLYPPSQYPKTSYYRVINYGLRAFQSYVTQYTLDKQYNELILQNQPKSISEVGLVQLIVNKEIPKEPLLIENKPLTVKKTKKLSTKYTDEVYQEIIEYFNHITGKSYKSQTKSSREYITKRLDEGWTVEEFKRVIENKSKTWLNTDSEQWLRPETLFSEKFESYLNERPITAVNNQQKSKAESIHEQINKAGQLRGGQG